MQPAAHRYTPELAEEAVRRAGLAGFKRLLHLVWTLVFFVFGFWRDSRAEGEERARRQRKRAVWLRERFVSLGATFVKIGQVLSTRPDLVPLPYVEEMATLQDQVPPFDSEIAHALIESELGRPIAETFAVFNPEPIAAASIGQVYKAKLKDGTDVVVKVQRPGLIPVVSLDLGIMRRIAVFIDKHPRLSRGMPYTAILDEFGLSMFDQADYTVEGHYADRFREHFKDFPAIETPRIHWDLTTSRVMTMDFVHGMKVTDLVALEDAGIAFRDVVSLGVRATIKQLLEDGFFHADVHPGNLFVDYKGTLVYIDFGMVGELTPYVQEKIVDVFLHSVHRHYEALVDDFIDLGFLSPQIDRAALVPVAERIFTAQYGEGDRRLSVKEIFAEVSKVLYEYPFRIPEKIAFILRTIITLEGIIHKLIPDYKFLETAAPYAAKILLTDAKASIREKLVDELFEGGQFKPDRLAKLFGTATKEPTFRFGEVAPAVLRYLTSPEGHRVREGLLNAAGQGSLASTDFSWRVYVEKAAQDPTWSLDDLLLPVCQFLETEDGVLFLIKLMDRREVLLGANGNAMASIGLAVQGRGLSAEGADALVRALNGMLRHSELTLQPLVERLAGFLASPEGQEVFYNLGQHLKAHPTAMNGHMMALVEQAARHPHLDIAPLVREFMQLVMRPEGKPWQDLMFQWFEQGHGPGDGLLRALGPLLADGRLRVSELAGPAFGFLFSKDGGELRDTVITTLRARVAPIDQLWRAAGQVWDRFRQPEAAPPPSPEEAVPELPG